MMDFIENEDIYLGDVRLAGADWVENEYNQPVTIISKAQGRSTDVYLVEFPSGIQKNYSSMYLRRLVAPAKYEIAD